MNNLNTAIHEADTTTLWELVTDVAEILKQREYVPDQSNTRYMFWYEVYKQIEAEINKRLVIDYMEV